MNTNPLMQYARHSELTVKLVSPQDWYPEGFIQYTLDGEVEVYPMLPKDELMLYNPDALLSGQAIINLIKSCCPSVLDPGKLFFPDANVLLLAIKRATYGDEHKQSHQCPECLKKVELLSTTNPEELAQLLKEGKVSDHAEEYTFNIDEVLMKTKRISGDVTVSIDGLTYYLQPLAISLKEQFSTISLKRGKLIKIYGDMLNRTEDISDEEKNKLTSEINNIQQAIIESNNMIIAKCIKKVQLPDDSVVSDYNMIKEFVDNAKSGTIEKLNEKIKEFNKVGLPEELDVVCSACGHEFKVPFEGFNQSDFFA